MKAIILAGGRATRLPDSAKNLPKALVEVGGKPILAHQLAWLESHGISDIKLALGFRSEQIIDYLKGRYEYVVEQEPLGTGGAFKFASEGLKEPFLALNGDTLSDLNLSQFIKEFQAAGFPHMMAVCEVSDIGGFGLVKFVSNRIVEFLEKPDAVSPDSAQGKFINAGVYILSPGIFDNINQTSFSIEKDIFPNLANNGEMGIFVHRGFWHDLGTEDRLEKVRRLFQGRNFKL